MIQRGHAAPEEVTQLTPQSWLLCVLVCDALGWGELYPEAIVPRPAGPILLAAEPWLTWVALVEAARRPSFDLDQHKILLRHLRTKRARVVELPCTLN